MRLIPSQHLCDLSTMMDLLGSVQRAVRWASRLFVKKEQASGLNPASLRGIKLSKTEGASLPRERVLITRTKTPLS
jgi:hypothetical protein